MPAGHQPNPISGRYRMSIAMRKSRGISAVTLAETVMLLAALTRNELVASATTQTSTRSRPKIVKRRRGYGTWAS